ncbi:alpha/beta hydrolase [Lutibacter sp.]|uniref:serine aminopeptidase domain-containing protein n=1 Tax=Lutibacter sp. TaxID=1925666 RepID=UPI0025C41886|nr:alpha/beta hydrolase [Lutibacter sp.]MCF6182031.1 alpha/beta hydrolase [Lutibacter sp.]
MRYLIILFSLIFISCNYSKKPNQLNNKKTISKTVEVIQKKLFTKITFPSKDGLLITADFYEVESNKPMILLCHQAGFSRGEYRDTAIKLNKLGYSCLAIDQRSGNKANGVINETVLAAKKGNLPTNYLDARQDIEAAIDFLYHKNNNKPIILIGSSYSATLVLLIGDNSDKVKAIVAFSPGEYYKTIDVKNSIKDIEKPVFVTSSKKESKALTELISEINPKYVTQYIPEEAGIHGSKALWKTTVGNENYWKAFTNFLQKNEAV